MIDPMQANLYRDIGLLTPDSPDSSDSLRLYIDLAPYTAARQRADLERLKLMSPVEFKKNLKDFQDVMYHIVVKLSSNDHDIIGRYIYNSDAKLTISRMEKLGELFELGYFELVYKLLAGTNGQSMYNWLNRKIEDNMRCVLLAVSANQRGLVHFLLKEQDRAYEHRADWIACAIEVIKNLKENGFIDDQKEADISKKIARNQRVDVHEIFSNIKWKDQEAISTNALCTH